MPPDKRRPQPVGGGRGPLENIATGNSNGSQDSLNITCASSTKPHSPYPIFWKPDFSAPGFVLAGVGSAS